MLDCVIVGGGIAGLATAYELSRRGVSFVLLERAARAGGVILSEEIDGFVIDGGPDALLIQKPDGIKLCEELGLGDRLVSTKPPRLAYIQRGGQLHALPAASVLGIPTRVGPFVSTRLFSWLGKLRMAAELFVPARRDEGDESIGSFMTRRFGREATTYLAEPLLAGIHAGDVDRLSIRALFPRFVEAERTHGSLLKAFRSNPNSASPANPESQIPNPGKGNGAFKSLPGGLSELIRALVSVLPSGSICLNSTVSRITEQREHGSFRVERASGDAIAARAVVIATPAYATSSLTRELDGEISGRVGARNPRPQFARNSTERETSAAQAPSASDEDLFGRFLFQTLAISGKSVPLGRVAAGAPGASRRSPIASRPPAPATGDGPDRCVEARP